MRARRSTMSGAVVCLLIIAWLSHGQAQTTQPSDEAHEPEDDHAGSSTLTVNGEAANVRWSDGDSFRFLDGPYEGHGVRLGGFNALESYGPVHRWGEWTPQELYDVAMQAKELARSGSWTCTTTGETDHYERVLVTCDDLTLAMVGAGLGHLFMIGSEASAEQVAAQEAARTQGLGMWAKGVPTAIVTSLHSASEGGDRNYNRVISTTDGSSNEVTHADTYDTCQEVCVGDSCLVYVPYDQRYGGDRPDCLR